MLIQGDCLEELKKLKENSVDAVVTDPPYDLTSIVKRFGKENSAPAQYGKDGAFSRVSKGFMGKEWDGTGIAFKVELWKQCLRVLKPGGHLISFGGSRTEHRMTVAIEDAGFEIRDKLCWIFASGFPKSLNVSKNIKKLISPDAQCVCGQSLKQKVEDLKNDYQECSRSYDGQLLGELNNAQDVSPLQDDAPEHSRAHQQKDAHDLKQDDKLSHNNESGKSHLSSDCSSHQNEVSGNSELNYNKLDDKPKNKFSEKLRVEHKRASHKSDTSHLVSDLVSSYLKVYTNLSQCQECKKIKIPEGIGTALKPAVEFITLARKPLSEKTIVENVIKWGTGGLDIDGTRIPTNGEQEYINNSNRENVKSHWGNSGAMANVQANPQGRFPANTLVTDDALNDGEMTKSSDNIRKNKASENTCMSGRNYERIGFGHSDSGSKSRFFDIDVWAEKHGILCYPKASKSERNEGCEGLEEKQLHERGCHKSSVVERPPEYKVKNNHPTVKPVHLMAYLIRLIAPQKGMVVLDPFLGSGTTGVAAKMLNREFIGIEKESEYIKIAEARINNLPKPLL